MTEVDWIDEAQAAPEKKRRIPKWLWMGCGCGCLLVVVLGIVVTIVGGRWFKSALDPEVQWPKIQRILPFDERPDHVELQMGFAFGIDQFVLQNDEVGYQAMIQDFSALSKAEFDQMFEEDPDNVPFGIAEPKDGQLGEMEVQGRAVRTLRFTGLGGFTMDELGPGIRIDLSHENRLVSVQLTRIGSKDELTEAEIAAFFEPFDVWRSE